MIIMLLEKAPQALQGELSRWLMEVKTGVYVGHVSARVREKLWEHSIKNKKSGGVFQAWSTNNEQGFKMRLHGMTDRRVRDWEGVELIEIMESNMTEVQKRRMRR